MALPLNEIINSLVKEFEKASLTTDLNRELLREYYADSPILNEIVPSRIKVTEATVTLPLAFSEIVKTKKNDHDISVKQIKNFALFDQDKISDKDIIADKIHKYLISENKANLNQKNLIDEIQKIGKETIKEFNLSNQAIQNLKVLQNAVNKKIPINEEASFIFKTEELEKIPSDRIFKLEFKILSD